VDKEEKAVTSHRTPNEMSDQIIVYEKPT
jgi:hypothetical protein